MPRTDEDRRLANIQIEPTRQTVSAIMALRRAAHLNRYPF